jgi:hypothetical protein
MENRQRRDYSQYRRDYSSRKVVEKEKISLKEVIILQSTVCGIILAVVLLISFIKIPFTINLRNNLKIAISSTSSIEEIISSSKNVVLSIGNIKNSVQTIFGGENTEVDDTNISVEQAINSEGQNRIDENILKQINDEVSFSGEQGKK